MIQRRKFLGSLAAFCVTSASLPRLVSAAGKTDELNWNSDVIETAPHNRALRHPVVTDVSLQPGGKLMAIVGDDHFVCIYDTQLEQYTVHLNQHSDWIRAARFSPDGRKLATAGNDRKLLFWNVDRWNAPAIEKRHPEAIFDVAFSNDGRKLATVGFEESLRIYDSQTGVLQSDLECACPDNHAVAFSSGDKWIAAGGRCGNIRVWDTATNRQLVQFKAHRQRIRSLEFTSDGKILSAGDDQLVKLTDPLDPTGERSFPRHASKLYATALLNDGLVATAGSDNKIHIWQLSDLQEIGSLKGHTGTVSCLDFSGNKLVSGSYDTHVRLWNTERYTSAPGQRQTQLKDGWNRKLN